MLTSQKVGRAVGYVVAVSGMISTIVSGMCAGLSLIAFARGEYQPAIYLVLFAILLKIGFGGGRE